MSILNVVFFWLYLIFLIPSILCTIFNLYYFLVDRTLRKALNNHVIIVVLFDALLAGVTDITWLIDYYRTGSPLSSTPAFCLTWAYIDFAAFASITILVAWASIERHILIFHQYLVATRTKRFLIHYFPLIIFSIYPFIYYFVIFFIRPCEVPFNYTKARCGIGYCAFIDPSIGLYDSIANNIVPVFIIIIFSIALIGRVWYGKYRMGQRFQWKNYRKMTFQLLSISALYVVLYFPTMILYTAYIAGLSPDVGYDFYTESLNFFYFIELFIPFVCAVALPEVQAKLEKLIRIFRRPKRGVGPETLTMNRLAGNRTTANVPVVQ